MKRNDIWILMIGILLFIISYNFDSQVNMFFENFQLPFIHDIFNFITNFWFAVLVMLIVPSFAFYQKNKKMLYLSWLTFFIAVILAFVIKLIVLRQRPTEALTYPWINIINYSFPSMHAMVVFALLPLLVKHLPKQKYFWIGFSFLIGFTRVYLGFHFLSDVVFGALFGYLIGFYLLELYEKKRLWTK